MVTANERQVGGSHYKDSAAPCPHCGTDLEHWDVAWTFAFNQFQYCISKYIWRKKGPGGRPLLDDLEKAKHHLEKYIECVKHDEDVAAGYGPDINIAEYCRRHAESKPDWPPPNPRLEPCKHLVVNEQDNGLQRCVDCGLVIDPAEPTRDYVDQDRD